MQIFISRGNEKRDYRLSRIIGMLKTCCTPPTTIRAAARRVASYRIIIFRVLRMLAAFAITINDKRICARAFSTAARRIAAVRLPHWPALCSDARTASSGSIGGFSSKMFSRARDLCLCLSTRGKCLGNRSVIRAAIAKLRARIVWADATMFEKLRLSYLAVFSCDFSPMLQSIEISLYNSSWRTINDQLTIEQTSLRSREKHKQERAMRKRNNYLEHSRH